MKVFLLGLDGMSLNIVERYIGASVLPNFKRVIDDGSYGILRSTIPPLTGPAWVSLATGKNPGKHGVYEFRRRKGYKTDLITKCTSPYAEPIWKILSRNRKSVAVINVPFTYPPDEVNGVIIAGFMTPSIETEFVFPKEVKNQLLRLIPNYRFDIGENTILNSNDKGQLLKEVYETTQDGRKLMNHFLDRNQADFFYVGFIGPDRLQHFVWDEIVSMDPECVKYYQLLDDILGDILRRMDGDAVLFIVSDHGFAEAKKGFYINKFFNELGLLHLKENPIKERLAKINITSDIINGFINRLGLLSVKKILPAFVLNFIRIFLRSKQITGSQIDWEKTRVFSLLKYGIVSVNLKGREPNGTVEKEDYFQLCEMVKQNLLGLEDPVTGEKVVKAVFKGKELYPTEYNIDDRPDLVVVVNEGYSIKEELWKNTIGENRFGNRHVTGDHHGEGLFVAYGSNIDNKRIDAEIYDIMPTLLYLMGTAIPEDVDGRVLTEVISHDFIQKNKTRFEKPSKSMCAEDTKLQQKEAEELENQLKNLGYLS